MTSSSTAELTPLMKQYWDLKKQIPDALLLFRMGDFYELFAEDAVVAAAILEITLTSRDKNKAEPVPMAGVPHHSVQGYIQKLLKAGKKVAIGEQVEDPESVKGTGKIVRREIVRVLTPGVQFDAEGSEANFLAILTSAETRGSTKTWVLSCLDASTGEAIVSQPLEFEALAHELRRLPIRHFLLISESVNIPIQTTLPSSVLFETLPSNYLSLERAEQILKEHYEHENLSVFLSTSAAIAGLGTLVAYALRTQQQSKLSHLKFPEPLQKPKSLVLGPNTSQHLDLADLFQLINHTRSTLGARQLKRWLYAPLRSPAEIHLRQTAVRELGERWSQVGPKLNSSLSQVYDLERICGRVNTQLANPKDTLALGQSLSSLQVIPFGMNSLQAPALLNLKSQIVQLAEKLGPLFQKILKSQREDAPITSKDGGIFKLGTTPELDRLISLTDEGQKWLVDLETRERQATGIPSLKVRYNRVFGYYIEITQAHLKSVPSHYQRKQTMVGAERFFTDELKKFEEEILTASVKQKSLEQELFQQLLNEIRNQTPEIMAAARALGELDALASLASLSQHSGWCFPSVDDSLDLDIEAGRHALVDQSQGGNFVPNSLCLSPSTRNILLITGPNMGGKSTVMRQTALILLLGQMGSPVPAVRARWGSVSSLYTRIGAQDAISRGQSTFMVEMSELAHILHHADERSFIILDEIGRGTSTYDGMSVAWSTLEWICTQIRARTLFATHYHELTHLTLPGLANAHMAVEASKSSSRNSLRFLYELKEGPTNESFGIHVAQLAGLPKPVVERAWRVLEDLENQSGSPAPRQMSLFDVISEEPLELLEEPLKEEPVEPVAPHPALQELTQMDINGLTPIQALNFIVKLQSLCTQESTKEA